MAYHVTSFATGSAIPYVYTVSTERFTVEIFDEYSNKFNETYNAASYTDPFLLISLVTDSSETIEIFHYSSTPDTGVYTYEFTVDNLYDNLTLAVQVYVESAYEHITGSPFTLTMLERDETLLCQVEDVFTAGYGITENSNIAD